MKNETARREIESLDYYLQNHTDDYSEESHTAMMMAVDSLSSSEKSNKWIPVSEGLPKDEQEVLITYKTNAKHHVWSAIWDKLHGRFYDKKYSSYISLDYVTAWMPSPKPYEE